MKHEHIHILGAPISVQSTSCIEFLCIGSRDKDSTQKELESHVAGPFVKLWSSAELMQLAFKPHHEGDPIGSWEIRRSLPLLAGGAPSVTLVIS